MTDALTERTMLMPAVVPKRTKNCYIGMPAASILDQACHMLWQAFGTENIIGIFVCGSSLQRPDWRDVDVRLMLADQEFDRLFGDPRFATQNGLWALICVSVSEHLSRITGLPIDFQIDAFTFTNAQHKGPRMPIGIWHQTRHMAESENP